MKKALALTLVLLTCVFAFAACDKGDSLIGTWTAEEDGVTMEMTFSDGGKVKVATMGITMEGTYTIKDGKMTATMSVEGIETPLFTDATYKVDGKKLTIDDGKDPITLTKK